jgi:transposase
MAFLSIIRRGHERDHVPIREISRRTGVSRNTIRKYLRSDMIEPTFRVPDRPSKLDPYAEKLSAWLRREAGRPRACRTSTRRSLISPQAR